MKLAQALNRTVLVCMPDFFGDDDTHACTLIDVEACGLWLDCDALLDRLGRDDDAVRARGSRVIGFFPFARILFVVDPSQFAGLTMRSTAPVRPAAAGQTREAEAREGRKEREEPPKAQPRPKNPKGRR